MNNMEAAHIAKIKAETAKIETETRFYPLIAIAVFLGAMAAFGKFFAS